jgi:hypothetical protein
MQYLKGYTKSRLLGIAHEAYCEACQDYDTNNVTKYSYPLIQHPITGEYALVIEDKSQLPEPPFWSHLVEKETMIADGWFEVEE